MTTGELRLLLIEDSDERLELFRRWIPPGFRLVCVRSAGRALRVLELDARCVYAGILLDHDLDQSVTLASELRLSGQQVAQKLAALIDPDTPVLIHSVNPPGARAMARTLVERGFDVTCAPFSHLNEQRLQPWLETVVEQWDPG